MSATATSLRCGLVCVMLGVGTSALPAAEWPPGKYMTQALAEMMVLVRTVTDDTEFGYDSGICLIGVYMLPGQTHTFSARFLAGTEYAVIAGGDEDCTDIDLAVLDANGRVLDSDDRTERLAIARFTPGVNTDGTIQVRLKGARRDAFVTYAIMKAGGYNVPKENLIAAGDRFLGMANRASELAQQDRQFARFLAERNQPAVFGAILTTRNDWVQVQSLTLGDYPCVMAAAGDTQVEDIDMLLMDAADNVLANDLEKDATPVIQFQPQRRERYTIRVQNSAENDKATFIVFGVLQMRPR